MQAELRPDLRQRPEGRHAESVIRQCVHCGFCNATCPTFQVLGNELDGPRGRIYLMKRALEGGPVTRETQRHLDRCLTCQACETTCPSGVSYHELLDIGRAWVDRQVRRPLTERLQRFGLRKLFGSQWLLRRALSVANVFAFLLPRRLRLQLLRPEPPLDWPDPRHERRMIALNGCIQPVVSPGIDHAAARLLDAAGVSLRAAPQGCCGAMSYHLGDQEEGIRCARARVRDWDQALDEGVEAIVVTATGCAAFISDYPRLFGAEPEMSGPAARVSDATHDVAFVLAREGLPEFDSGRDAEAVALHCPCTLKHGLDQAGILRELLQDAGVRLAPVRETIACCGSAGAYSLLQARLSERIRDRKLADLETAEPAQIVTANIGCLHHLAAGSGRPVRHWVELLAERLPDKGGAT